MYTFNISNCVYGSPCTVVGTYERFFEDNIIIIMLMYMCICSLQSTSKRVQVFGLSLLNVVAET